MPGIVDAQTLASFADAARRGSLTPQLGAGGGTGGGGPPTAVSSPAPGGGSPIPSIVAKIIQQILLSDVKSRFSAGTDPTGAKWRPLKHARPNGGDVPLRDTGILMASFAGGYDATSVWVGTTHPGAALHNFGGTVRGKGKMLAIPLTKEAKRSGGPRRWKGNPLQFRPTRKARVFLLVEGTGKTRAKRGKKKAEKPEGKQKPKKGGKDEPAMVGNIRRRQLAKAAKRKERRAKKAARGSGTSPELRIPSVAQFLLVDQVTIPARPFMGISKKAWGQIEDAVAEAVKRGWMSGGSTGFSASIG